MRVVFIENALIDRVKYIAVYGGMHYDLNALICLDISLCNALF